jgi:hypothetical protein
MAINLVPLELTANRFEEGLLVNWRLVSWPENGSSNGRAGVSELTANR